MCVMKLTFSSFPGFSFLPFLGNVWDTFMPCNDIKEMLKLYIFYAVCGVGVFGSHLITQIPTSSHFPENKKVWNDCNCAKLSVVVKT